MFPIRNPLFPQSRSLIPIYINPMMDILRPEQLTSIGKKVSRERVVGENR